jgi:serine/threonine protein kinase
MKFLVRNLRLLHSGGNGDVFLGVRSDTGELVVLKRLREHHVLEARKSFEREKRILARQLGGVVPLLGVGMDESGPYYVMPYFSGGSLTRYKATLSDAQLVAVATTIATALCNLHAAQIAHGDIKPDNVLVSHDGHLQVADPLGNGIGCTVLFSRNRGGTPGYWAPEVSGGGQISFAADVYSYGATLYELLTGRRPIDGQQINPTAEGYAVAPKIREIIVACCSRHPGARPTMKEVLRMLGGQTWAALQTERLQRQELVTICIVGVAALASVVLSHRSPG